MDLEEEDDDKVDAIIEMSRKRREELLKKLQSSAANTANEDSNLSASVGVGGGRSEPVSSRSSSPDSVAIEEAAAADVALVSDLDDFEESIKAKRSNFAFKSAEQSQEEEAGKKKPVVNTSEPVKEEVKIDDTNNTKQGTDVPRKKMDMFSDTDMFSEKYRSPSLVEKNGSWTFGKS